MPWQPQEEGFQKAPQGAHSHCRLHKARREMAESLGGITSYPAESLGGITSYPAGGDAW